MPKCLCGASWPRRGRRDHGSALPLGSRRPLVSRNLGSVESPQLHGDPHAREVTAVTVSAMLIASNRLPMLQLKPARLGLAAERPNLRAGLPRRYIHGSARRHVQMSEDSPASAADEQIDIAEPEPAGEPIDAFFRRSVLDDVTLKALVKSSRALGIDFAQQRWFRPACFSPDHVAAYHRALASVEQDPRVYGFSQLFDHLWLSPVDSALPLDIRMAKTRQPDIGGDWRDPLATAPTWTPALKIARKTALRRDRLVAALVQPIRSGQWNASGFLPGDYRRDLVPLPAAWWSDKTMVCDWHAGELRSEDGRTAGRPTFFGLTLSASSPAIFAIPRTDKTSAAADLEAELESWLISAWPKPERRSKPDWFAQAKEFANKHVPEELFNRAWATAAKVHPEMSRRGKPRLKTQR